LYKARSRGDFEIFEIFEILPFDLAERSMRGP